MVDCLAMKYSKHFENWNKVFRNNILYFQLFFDAFYVWGLLSVKFYLTHTKNTVWIHIWYVMTKILIAQKDLKQAQKWL